MWLSRSMGLGCLVLLVLAFRPLTTLAQETFPTSELWLVTSSGRHHISVELADTPARRSQGLMFREAMPLDHGMLFDFGAPQPVSMWMRNTLIPLDMVFINSDGSVHHVIHNAEPQTDTVRSSNGAVSGVLELNGGVAAVLGVTPGDRVEHPFFER